MVSERIKAALAVAKLQGRMNSRGRIRSKAWYRRFMEMSIEARQKAAGERAEAYRAHIKWALRQPSWHGGVISFHEAAKKLNAKGVPSITERSWGRSQVQRMARRLWLNHPQVFFISDEDLHAGLRVIVPKAPLATVEELIEHPHWPRLLGRARVHQALKVYRAELVKEEPEYKRIGLHLDRWTELRLRIMHIKRKNPTLFCLRDLRSAGSQSRCHCPLGQANHSRVLLEVLRGLTLDQSVLEFPSLAPRKSGTPPFSPASRRLTPSREVGEPASIGRAWGSVGSGEKSSRPAFRVRCSMQAICISGTKPTNTQGMTHVQKPHAPRLATVPPSRY
jgi:hypothetical protein